MACAFTPPHGNLPQPLHDSHCDSQMIAWEGRTHGIQTRPSFNAATLFQSLTSSSVLHPPLPYIMSFANHLPVIQLHRRERIEVMSSSTEPLPGTSDIWEPEVFGWVDLEGITRNVFGRYGYQELRTPVFERTEVFVRNLGNETDVVQKAITSASIQGELQPTASTPTWWN